MEIRDAVPDDAPALGRLHAEAWQKAYAGQLPEALLAGITVQRRTGMWENVLAGPRGERERIAVAALGGSAVGFAWTGPCRDEPSDGQPELGELYAINVAPEHWGAGVGAALLAAAHEALTAAGFQRAVLWVLPGNTRARGFYESRGWVADGTDREASFGEHAVPEVRYAISFTES